MSIQAKHWYRFTYLQSDEWKTLRLKVFAARGGRCCVCSKESISNDVHHIYYSPDKNDVGQLVVLCRQCHDLVHKYLAPIGALTGAEKHRAIIVFNKLKAVLKQRLEIRDRADRLARIKDRGPGPHCECCYKTSPELQPFFPVQRKVTPLRGGTMLCPKCTDLVIRHSRYGSYTSNTEAWDEIGPIFKLIREGDGKLEKWKAIEHAVATAEAETKDLEKTMG